MTEEIMRKTFSRNLRRLLELNDKQAADLVRDLGVPFSTVSNWMNGQKMPRMGNIELLAKYLNCEKSDLIEDKADSVPEAYYLNDDAREFAQFLFENPEYKVLFDASRKVRKEDIQFVKDFLDRVSKA